jgi:hypothetical protein
MNDLDDSNYLRVENAVLTFIRNHPGRGRREIYNGLPCFDPILINIALFLLEEKKLIEGQYECVDDESIVRRFDPIVS